MKTAISIPDDTFRRVEARVAALNMNRSEFYVKAAERYLDELDQASLTAQIDEAIERVGQPDSSEIANLGLLQLGEFTKDDEW
jgi:metal-responsive CopG/Arc/MetJ family transcriptional regulator